MITITNDILEQMILQATAAAPVEACGILAGKDGGVEKFYPMTNADNSSEHFALVPQEHFSVVKQMRSEGQEMVAVYHSHPASPARPSEEDIRLALMPGAKYVILSLAGEEPDVKCFEIEDGEVTKIEIEVIKD